jgi:hypothetical protein
MCTCDVVVLCLSGTLGKGTLRTYPCGRVPTTFWAGTISKEMKDVHVAFKILLDGKSAPIGYKKIPCHTKFDIKMVDF